MAHWFKRAHCPECGRPIRHGAVLCAECGHHLRAERLSEHCGQCGARLESRLETCPICGALRVRRRFRLGGSLAAQIVFVAAVGIVGLVGWRMGHWGLLLSRFQALALVSTESPTPTPYPTWTPRPTVGPSSPATATLPPTATVVPTLTTVPTAMPTATVEIMRYQVKEGDTPLGIAIEFGVELDDLLKRNNLGDNPMLQIGQELIISGFSGGPLPTEPAAASPTASPTIDAALQAREQSSDGPAAASALSPSAAAQAAAAGQMPRLASAAGVSIASAEPTPTPAPLESPAATPTPDLYSHVIEQGDMLVSLALKYDVTVEELIALNKLSPQALLNLGQRILIPGITNTPTLSPTPLMTETPTATQTPVPTALPKSARLAYPFPAPLPLAPVDGARIIGSDQDVILNWASVGILCEDEWYLVEFWLPGADQPLVSWTKATSLRIEPELRADQPSASRYAWQVQVAMRDSAGRPSAVLSPASARFDFSW